jgi:two-component SAPR family response regulator
MHKSPDLIIQITAGFNYKSSDSIKVKIDASEYDFYTDEDTAWAKDDKKVIYAMKKGLVFEITGVSNKGTKVTDTYTLKGFTAASNQLINDC